MFMRFRKSNSGGGYQNGDLGRIEAQKSFYNSLIDKVLNPSAVMKAPKLLGIVRQNVKTNFTNDELLSYITAGLKMNKENIHFYQLPGESEYKSGVSYFVTDKEQTVELIRQNFTPDTKLVPVNIEVSTRKNKYIKVAVEDASGSRENLLEIVCDTLTSYGFKVVSKEKSEDILPHSSLTDYTAKHASNEILKIYPNFPSANGKDEKDTGADVLFTRGRDFDF